MKSHPRPNGKGALQLTNVFPPAWIECRQGNMYESVAHSFKDEFSDSQLCAHKSLNY